MPIRQWSATVQPWSTAAWPIVTPLPMVAGGLLMLCTGGLVTGLVLDGANPVAPSAQSFQTLGRHAPRDARAVAPVLRVVLQDASPAALTAWLARHDAELLDGPSAIGVLTVRVGLTAAGLPAGLQIVGPRHADAVVLRAARAYEQAAPFVLPPGAGSR